MPTPRRLSAQPFTYKESLLIPNKTTLNPIAATLNHYHTHYKPGATVYLETLYSKTVTKPYEIGTKS